MSTTSSSLESQLATAVGEGKVPHAVVFAADRDGSFQYSHATGKVSVEDGAADIQEDAVFQLASQTKLMTVIAAMQVVERGLIALDDDVAELLPELAEQSVLTGFDGDDKPILEARKGPISLRHLLTHTSGAAYDASHPLLIKYQMQRGVIPNSGPDVLSRHTHPLVFQPGSQWLYGTGIDWAGLAIERLTKSSLEEFMKSNIWDPLNAKTITFFPARTAGLETRIPSLSARGPDSKLYPYNEPFINSGVTGCFGGSGGYASLSEYLRLLTSLLRNDGKILKPASVDELFSPQLTDAQAQSFKGALTGPVGAFFIGEFQAEKYKHDWAFGGAVSVEGYEDGRRRAGTLTWGGMANTFWMIDREAGVAVTFGTQLLPPGDVEVRKVISVVEKEVYKMAGVA